MQIVYLDYFSFIFLFTEEKSEHVTCCFLQILLDYHFEKGYQENVSSCDLISKTHLSLQCLGGEDSKLILRVSRPVDAGMGILI